MPATTFFAPPDIDAVRRFYRGATDAPPTPLRRRVDLAADLGIGELLVKDESSRFGLPAFKIVGTRYAVARLLADGPVGALACATAGNHGRAVARAAREAGRDARVYVPAGTAPARLAALHGEGAHVVETGVGYDEAVRRMATDAAAAGWTIVSDTGWDGYERVPRLIMAGYTWILDEAAAAWGHAPPDVIVVQAGVGSFAGAVAGWLDSMYGAARPQLVVVEPTGADCVATSIRAGRLTPLQTVGPTSMAGLRCGEVSLTAWPALARGVDAAVTVTDREATVAIARLADAAAGNAPIAAGPSGAAGLAGLTRLMTDPARAADRARLGLGPHARVLVFNTEGPID